VHVMMSLLHFDIELNCSFCTPSPLFFFFCGLCGTHFVYTRLDPTAYLAIIIIIRHDIIDITDSQMQTLSRKYLNYFAPTSSFISTHC
jgi:hypothetical protein